MSSFKIEKIKTYEQAENFAKFIIKNSEFNSVNDIIKFIKTIKKIIGVVEMSVGKFVIQFIFMQIMQVLPIT